MDEPGVSLVTVGEEKRGTVVFMPPEQVIDSAMVKEQSDIYCVGGTLYWLLTGEFSHDFTARDRRGEVKDPYRIICEDPIVPIRERDGSIPQKIAEVIEKSLHNDPEERFESAAGMARALREAMK